MALHVMASGSRATCPEGLHPAVCVDVTAPEEVETQFGTKTKITIKWQTATRDEASGERYLVSARYTLSLNEKSYLRRDLETWRGRSFTREELYTPPGFDVLSIVGAPCQVMVKHKMSDQGLTFADVASVAPAAAGADPIAAEHYEREPWPDAAAPPTPTPAAAPFATSPHVPAEDEIPF